MNKREYLAKNIPGLNPDNVWIYAISWSNGEETRAIRPKDSLPKSDLEALHNAGYEWDGTKWRRHEE